MSMPIKTYRSDLLGALHEGATDLLAVGAIDKATMRRFDLACLTPVEPLRVMWTARMPSSIFSAPSGLKPCLR